MKQSCGFEAGKELALQGYTRPKSLSSKPKNGLKAKI